MTQGIFVAGKRPASKKAVKEAVIATPEKVRAEATSIMGNEFDGPITSMEVGQEITFVGPDPYTKRNFYGQIKRTKDGYKVT